jgi:hypothetical protein
MVSIFHVIFVAKISLYNLIQYIDLAMVKSYLKHLLFSFFFLEKLFFFFLALDLSVKINGSALLKNKILICLGLATYHYTFNGDNLVRKYTSYPNRVRSKLCKNLASSVRWIISIFSLQEAQWFTALYTT